MPLAAASRAPGAREAAGRVDCCAEGCGQEGDMLAALRRRDEEVARLLEERFERKILSENRRERGKADDA